MNGCERRWEFKLTDFEQCNDCSSVKQQDFGQYVKTGEHCVIGVTCDEINLLLQPQLLQEIAITKGTFGF